MTAPVWMAAPPEVHSTLLTTGPGLGSLLAAASAWETLSAEYAAAATELSAILSSVQTGSWNGQTAAHYVTAHGPYLGWLTQTSANSAGAAAQHQAAATAYSAALAAMPTLAELAANHVVHGVLVATNFFGINAIPIALNEADYARMWIQAATTMSLYQAITSSAQAAVAPAEPSPPILAAEAATTPPADPIEELLAWSEHFTSMYRALKGLVLNPFGTIVQIITDFATNPSAALTTWLPLLYVGAYAATFAVLGTPLYAAVAGPAGAIPLVLGLALSGVVELPAELVAEVPTVPAEQHLVTVASIAPTVTTAGAAPTPPSPPSPAPATTPTPTSAPAAGVQGFAYLVAGPGPGPVFGPNLHNRAAAGAPASGISAAAAASAASAKGKARRRRRQDVKNRGHRDEFLTMDGGPAWLPQDPPVETTTASATGTGPLGFAGTAPKSTSNRAAGLTTLAGDSFTNAPSVPMMPRTWGADPSHTDEAPHTVVEPTSTPN